MVGHYHGRTKDAKEVGEKQDLTEIACLLSRPRRQKRGAGFSGRAHFLFEL